MAVHTFTYPLSLPAAPTSRTIELITSHKAAATKGEFSEVRQTHDYNADLLQAVVTLPPMRRAEAAEWVSVLLNLKGVVITFLMGISAQDTARGIATGSPVVNGASQTGDELSTTGWTAGQTGIMKAGEWLSCESKLLMVTEDANSDGGGVAFLTVWPYITTALANSAAIDVTDPHGTWYLLDDVTWSIDVAQNNGLTFSCEHTVV